MEKDKYYIARMILPLSSTSAVVFQEAASKPPDFQPLLTSEEMKRLRQKVSKHHALHTSKAAVSRRRRK
jgi:hypothetical protein